MFLTKATIGHPIEAAILDHRPSQSGSERKFVLNELPLAAITGRPPFWEGRRFFLFFLLSAFCSLLCLNAQAVYDLPSDRRTFWNAGLDPVGGIPNYPSVTCSGLDATGATDATSKINSCISAAANNTAVFIPAGVYRVDGQINMKSNVTLRGAGTGGGWLPAASPGATTLNMNGGQIRFNGGAKDTTHWQPGPGAGVSITTGFSTGSTNLTLSNASSPVNFQVGDILAIYQDNTDSAVMAASANGCSWCGEDNSLGHWKEQYSKITAKNGNVITIDPPVYYATPNFSGAQVRRQIFDISKAGVENMRLKGNGANNKLIYMTFARNSWVKNVETYNTGGHSGDSHIEFWFSYGCEVRDSYVHTGAGHDSGADYGIFFLFWNSNHKVENNVIRDTRHSIIFEGGGSGSALLYNYSNDNWESVQGQPTVPDTYLAQDMTSNHGPHPHMNLWEGNIAEKFTGDFTMGSASHITAFRNYFTGKRDTPSTLGGWGVWGVEIEKYNRYYNLVGNVIGQPAWTSGTLLDNGTGGSGPVVYRFGYNSAGGGYTDSLPYTTAIKHGNYDYVTDSVAHWDGGSDHTLMASMYYASKPGWFGSVVWPPIGPDVAGFTSAIPAKVCYDQGLMPNCLQSGTPPPPPGGSGCDLNADNSTNVSDVQLCVNQAISLATCTTGDINHDSTCNVVDVQRVVNAALGGMCVSN